MATQELLQELRPGAFAIAYRMTGSVSEAEGIVQEGFLRLHRAMEDGQELASPRAYLSTVVTRLAIDELRSARARRETYVGEWLPEPIVTSGEDDPARHAETADSPSLAFLVVLETLSPQQRAAFLLHDVFDHPDGRIAEIIGKSEPAARQLATRARRHVADRRPRVRGVATGPRRAGPAFPPGGPGGRHGGAGGNARRGRGAARRRPRARPGAPPYGRRRVAAALSAWLGLVKGVDGIGSELVQVNGEPGVLVRDPGGAVLAVWAIGIAGDRVQSIRSVVNPDKLGHLGPVGTITDVLERARRNRTPQEYGPPG